jgi:hypothetical protein
MMKTDNSRWEKTMVLIASFLLVAPMLFADGTISEIYLTGTADTPAGEFVVLNSDDIYYFDGLVYEVYEVRYEDHSKDMFIAVHTGADCNSFIAYNGEFTFFYSCDENGFGIRKVMFNNPSVHETFSPEKFRCQSVLCKKRKTERRLAIETVATFVPDLYNM